MNAHDENRLRNRIVHDYLGVNYGIVWTVASRNRPVPIAELEKILPPVEGKAEQGPARDRSGRTLPVRPAV
jgi:hypothetical protein